MTNPDPWALAIEAAAKEVENTNFTTASDGSLHKHNAIKFALANRIRALSRQSLGELTPQDEVNAMSTLCRLFMRDGPFVMEGSTPSGRVRISVGLADGTILAALTQTSPPDGKA